MIFDNDTVTRLLGSIESNRLVLLCGAGLSIPPPSDLMSAANVSRTCYDKYQPIKVLPANLRDEIDQLAEYFHGSGEFESLFIGSLVPWNDLAGQPNSGHAAVADFLICRAACAVLSANFDTLIEQWAFDKKIAMRGALDGQEAVTFISDANPLIKFHGCLIRNRPETLWTKTQLSEPSIAQRVKSCSDWMNLTLPGKDLLVIGFWTDWGYLNDVLADSINVSDFGSVTVLDIATTTDLQNKAPTLWSKLTTGTKHFQHIQASGADALEELRIAFSKVWLKKFYALAKTLVETDGKTYAALEPKMKDEYLYNCRRDAEGVPSNRAATMKEPPTHATAAAFFHHLLAQSGATPFRSWYEYGGKRIRVVQGAGQGINGVRERYKEPPALIQPDVVVCAGSIDLATPGKIVSSGAGASIVRPAAGGTARWLTLDQARLEFSI